MIKTVDTKMVILDADDFERMKNCTNCEHNEVCVVVHDRKIRTAGDYSPCSKWKLMDGDDG